jgi:hypothetical protein
MPPGNLIWARVSAVTGGGAEPKAAEALNLNVRGDRNCLPRTQEPNKGRKREDLSREVAPFLASDIHSELAGSNVALERPV